MHSKNLLIPAILGLVSFIVAFKILVVLNQDNLAAGIPIGSINAGITNICIKSNQSGKAFGIISQSVEYDRSGIFVNYNGDLKFSVSSQAASPNLSGNLSFNSLGQLIGGYIKFTNDKNSISIGMLEVNPIRVSIKANTAIQNIDQEVKIPGPIEVRKSGKDSYALYGPFLDLVFKNGEDRKNLISRIPFTFEKNEQCSEISPLALDQYIQMAQKFLATVPKINLFPLLNLKGL